MGVIYLLQLFELPYLVQTGLAATSATGSGLFADALLYVNAFGLMCFSFQMLVMCEGYFFPEKRHSLHDYCFLLLPAALVVIPLLLPALGLVSYPDGWRIWAKVIVTIVATYYFCLNVRMALRIGRAIRRANEDTYADTDDFPLQFAQFIQWVPTLVLVLHIANFHLDDPWVKFVRDLIFIGANVAFCIYTLNPWRKGITVQADAIGDTGTELPLEEGQGGEAPFRLSDDRYDDLARRLDDLRLQDVADRCGFSTPSSMARSFRQLGKPAPSTFRNR